MFQLQLAKHIAGDEGGKREEQDEESQGEISFLCGHGVTHFGRSSVIHYSRGAMQPGLLHD